MKNQPSSQQDRHPPLHYLTLTLLLFTASSPSLASLSVTGLLSGAPPFPTPLLSLDAPSHRLSKRFPIYLPFKPNRTPPSPSSISSIPSSGHVIAPWAAVGDSYSAGIGAGKLINWMNPKSGICARYTESYPMQLSKFEPMADKFDFLSCTGDKIRSIIEQVESIGGMRELITVSAGGNDLELFSVLNSCIFQLFKGLDCDSHILSVHAKIAGEEFHSNLQKLLQKALAKTTNDGLLVWTGYVTFFNIDDDSTEDGSGCDTISWAGLAKFMALLRINQTKHFLTIEHRKKLNDLVLRCNAAIREVIEEHGDPRAVFLEFESEFEGRRYCERKSTVQKNKGGSYIYHPFCAHKNHTDDVTTCFQHEIINEVIGTPAHDVYEGLKQSLLRIAGEQGEEGRHPHGLMKRWFDDFDFQDYKIFRLLGNPWVRAFHLTSAGNSIIAKKVFREVYHHATAKYFTHLLSAGTQSSTPAEESRKNSGGSIGILCASDYQHYDGRSVPVEIFHAAINASCDAFAGEFEKSGSSLSGIGRSWNFTWLPKPNSTAIPTPLPLSPPQSEMEKNEGVRLCTPSQKDQAMANYRRPGDLKVVMDVALFERGPGTVDGFWVKGGQYVERRKEIVRWHCEEMLKGILKECDDDENKKSGGASIDGRVIWRLGLQRSGGEGIGMAGMAARKNLEKGKLGGWGGNRGSWPWSKKAD